MAFLKIPGAWGKEDQRCVAEDKLAHGWWLARRHPTKRDLSDQNGRSGENPRGQRWRLMAKHSGGGKKTPALSNTVGREKVIPHSQRETINKVVDLKRSFAGTQSDRMDVRGVRVRRIEIGH